MPRNTGWFRVYDRNIDSPQIVELTLAERGLLLGLWSLASARNGVIPYTPRQIRRRLFVEEWSDEQMLEALDRLCELDLLSRNEEGWTPVRWGEHQYDYPSDRPEATAARKRKQRERERTQNSSHEIGTDVSRVCHDTDKRREEKKSLYTEQSSSSNAQARASHPAASVSAPPEVAAAAAAASVQAQGEANEEILPKRPASGQPRREPDEYEITRLCEMGYSREEIALAVAQVKARSSFTGAADWTLYLQGKLRDNRAKPVQTAMPMLHLDSVPARAAPTKAEREAALKKDQEAAAQKVDALLEKYGTRKEA